MNASQQPAVTRRSEQFSRMVAILVGLVFAAAGLWALLAPRSFFEGAAHFEPYNAHFIRDIGAFQLGLGAVLLLAAWLRDALLAALAGVAVGAVAHLVAHVADRHLGGEPAVDIPAFAVIAVLLIAAAVARARTLKG